MFKAILILAALFVTPLAIADSKLGEDCDFDGDLYSVSLEITKGKNVRALNSNISSGCDWPIMLHQTTDYGLTQARTGLTYIFHINHSDMGSSIKVTIENSDIVDTKVINGIEVPVVEHNARVHTYPLGDSGTEQAFHFAGNDYLLNVKSL